MLATWPYISPEVIFWTPIVLAFGAGWFACWAVKGWLLPIVLVLGVLGYSMLPAAAHDHSRPELKPWFESLKSRAGAPCCDGSDATKLIDVDWESKDGRYRVRIDGQWIDVPEDAMVDGPNKAGVTMVWPWFKNGKPAVRCFKPGSMG